MGRDAADRPRAGAGGGGGVRGEGGRGGVPGEGGGLRLRVRAGGAQRPRARSGNHPHPAPALIVDIMLVEYLYQTLPLIPEASKLKASCLYFTIHHIQCKYNEQSLNSARDSVFWTLCVVNIQIKIMHHIFTPRWPSSTQVMHLCNMNPLICDKLNTNYS